MPKITVLEGVSYDPYEYPELQPTTETKIVETDIKEVADQDKDTKYVEAKEDEPSVGNSYSASENSNEQTTKKNKKESFNPSALAVETNSKRIK